MKRLSFLLLSLSMVGSLDAMHGGAAPVGPAPAVFVPGPALMFKKLYRSCVPSKGELVVVGGISAAVRYYGQGSKSHHASSFMDNPYYQAGILLMQSYSASQPLAEADVEDGKQDATALTDGVSRFASVLIQNAIYKYGICNLVSKLSCCKQANVLIDRGCQYHWTALVGITLAEEFALMTADKACKNFVLKPLVDGTISKIQGFMR